MKNENTKGTLILLITAFIWGVSFVAQTSAASHIGSFTLNASRSTIAFIFLFCFIHARARIAKKILTSVPNAPLFPRHTIKAGMWCGLTLFVAANLQQFGIAAYPEGVAVAGRAGFLTTTYIIMVAICARFFGQKLHPLIWASTLFCVAGMYMLCVSGGMDGIYLGDILVLLSAVAYTVQILTVDHFASRNDGITMSCVQFPVMALLSWIAAILFESPDVSQFVVAWLPIIYLGIFSNGIAYTMQIVGQKYAQPSVASVVMSLESVFSAIAGWLILHESLSGREILGCVLVFVAVLLAQVPSFLRPKS